MTFTLVLKKEFYLKKYICVKCESSITYHSKATANVKVFADKQTDKRTGQKLYALDLSMRVHKNEIELNNNNNNNNNIENKINNVLKNAW